MFAILKEGNNELTSYPLIDIQGGCPKTKHREAGGGWLLWLRITNQKTKVSRAKRAKKKLVPARHVALPYPPHIQSSIQGCVRQHRWSVRLPA